MTIHYEPHPVSPERKAELRAQGLKIIDARFAPKGTAKPTPVALKPADNDGLAQLRADYADLLGKKAYHGWDADQLQAKIDEALSAANN